MSSYNSSDVFQQTNTTESNGYNVFPAAYMSKGVGGKRKSLSRKDKQMKMKKGGDCGCSKSQQTISKPFQLFGGKKNKRSMKQKNKKNKTRKSKY